MTTTIDLRLYATLQAFMPENADRFPITPGMPLEALVAQLGIADQNPRLFFVNGIKADLKTTLLGGERVAIFPPIGGG